MILLQKYKIILAIYTIINVYKGFIKNFFCLILRISDLNISNNDFIKIFS